MEKTEKKERKGPLKIFLEVVMGTFLIYIILVILLLLGILAFSYFDGSFERLWLALMGI